MRISWNCAAIAELHLSYDLKEISLVSLLPLLCFIKLISPPGRSSSPCEEEQLVHIYLHAFFLWMTWAEDNIDITANAQYYQKVWEETGWFLGNCGARLAYNTAVLGIVYCDGILHTICVYLKCLKKNIENGLGAL